MSSFDEIVEAIRKETIALEKIKDDYYQARRANENRQEEISQFRNAVLRELETRREKMVYAVRQFSTEQSDNQDRALFEVSKLHDNVTSEVERQYHEHRRTLEYEMEELDYRHRQMVYQQEEEMMRLRQQLQQLDE